MPPLHSLHSGAQVLARRQSYGPCQRGPDAPTMQEVGQPWPGHHRCIAGSVRPAAGLSPPRTGRRRLHSTRGTASLSLTRGAPHHTDRAVGVQHGGRVSVAALRAARKLRVVANVERLPRAFERARVQDACRPVEREPRLPPATQRSSGRWCLGGGGRTAAGARLTGGPCPCSERCSDGRGWSSPPCRSYPRRCGK